MLGGLTAGAPDRLQPAVDRALDARLRRGGSAPVALGLSGGGDSRALLHLAADWARRAGRPLLALTVDHALSPESSGWTRRAGEMAAAAGAGWRALAWEGAKPATGLPAAARAARHALLAEATRAAGACVLLLAHTADDARENRWMRAQGEAPLPPLREWGPSPAWPQGRGVFLLRPLLAFTRAEIRAWLMARGLAWIDDPANADPRFARTRARAALDGVSGGAGWIEPPPASPPLHAFGPADGSLVLDRPSLLAHPDARHALSAALLCASGGSVPPRGDALDRALARVARDGAVLTLAGARVAAEGPGLRLTRDRGRTAAPGFALAAGAEQVWDGRFGLTSAAPGWNVTGLGGRMAQLPRRTREALRGVAPAARMALPALLSPQGEVALGPPFGGAPVRVRPLVLARFQAVCGGVTHEPPPAMTPVRP